MGFWKSLGMSLFICWYHGPMSPIGLKFWPIPSGHATRCPSWVRPSAPRSGCRDRLGWTGTLRFQNSVALQPVVVVELATKMALFFWSKWSHYIHAVYMLGLDRCRGKGDIRCWWVWREEKSYSPGHGIRLSSSVGLTEKSASHGEPKNLMFYNHVPVLNYVYCAYIYI